MQLSIMWFGLMMFYAGIPAVVFGAVVAALSLVVVALIVVIIILILMKRQRKRYAEPM